MQWLADLQDWAETRTALISLLSLVVGLLAFCAMIFVGAKARDGFPSLGETLQDRASWPALIARWQRNRSKAYTDYVGSVLGFANAFYGLNPLSWRAFERCLQMAIIYPVIAIFLGWFLFNIHSPAGIGFFVSVEDGVQRTMRAIALFFVFFTAFWAISKLDEVVEFFLSKAFGVDESNSLRSHPLLTSIRLAIDFVGPIAGSAAIAAVVLATTGALAGAGAAVLVLILVVAISESGFSTIAIAVTAGVAIAVFNGAANLAAIFILLYLLLPILNAIADFLSLAITRTLLRREHHASSTLLPILTRAAIDLLLALICLAGLLAAISLCLDLWAAISPETLPFTATAYLTEVIKDPTRGTALYLMVTTTLLPTFVHFIAGLGAMFTYRSRALAAEADILAGKLATDTPLTVIERGDMVGRVRRIRWVAYACAIAITAAIAALVLLPIWWLVIGRF